MGYQQNSKGREDPSSLPLVPLASTLGKKWSILLWSGGRRGEEGVGVGQLPRTTKNKSA